jgi:hypothetical protein
MTAIVILFILTNTCAATPPSSSLDSGTVVVEASGNVPGFTETQTEDEVLSEIVHNVAHILFVANKLICHEIDVFTGPY